MISIKTVVRPNLVNGYTQRNGSGGKWRTLALTQGASGKYNTDVESSWLIAKGGTGKNLSELWSSYLATKGFTQGNLKDRMKAFFASGTQA